MATAYNLSSYRTHFIKSDDKDDKVRFLKDVIAWSGLSAAYFFGKINVPNYSWVFSDSGTPTKTERQEAIFQDVGNGSKIALGICPTEILVRGLVDERSLSFPLVPEPKQASRITRMHQKHPKSAKQ